MSDSQTSADLKGGGLSNLVDPRPTAMPVMDQLIVMVVATLVLMSNVDGAPIPAQNLDFYHTTENCGLPKHEGKVKKFEFDSTLPMRKRRAAHLLDAEYIAKYEKAYELLRALPDSDGRSWKNQAKIHCLYCDDGLLYNNVSYPLEIHNGWFFLPWHRLFLYFHERILAKLIGDDTFALPFWNWDNQTPTPPYANVVPPIFSKNTSSLYDANRSPCAVSPNIVDLNSIAPIPVCNTRTPAKQRAENNGVLYTQLVTGAVTPELFFGSPYHLGDAGGLSPGTLEVNPHGKVHFFVANPRDPHFGDMGNFANSSRDPTFYPHHANVDRIWKVWKKLPGGIRKDPEHPDFLNSEFVFYDEEGDRVAAKVSQTLNTNLLRYKYQNVPNPWISAGVKPGHENKIPLCFPASKTKLQQLIKATPVLGSSMILNSQPLSFRVTRPPPSKGEEILEVDGINMDFNQNAQFNAYLFFPTAVLTSPAACPEFFGTFNYVPHAGQANFTPKRVWRAALSGKLKALNREDYSEIIVTLVLSTGIPVTFSGAKITYVHDTRY